MTYGKAISTLESETQETVEASVMLEAIDKILSMKTINAVSKDSLKNAVRFLRNHVNELLKEQEAVEPEEIVDDFYPIGDPLRTIGWKCGHCGERIAGYDSFCPSCGKEVKWDGKSKKA